MEAPVQENPVVPGNTNPAPSHGQSPPFNLLSLRCVESDEFPLLP